MKIQSELFPNKMNPYTFEGRRRRLDKLYSLVLRLRGIRHYLLPTVLRTLWPAGEGYAKAEVDMKKAGITE